MPMPKQLQRDAYCSAPPLSTSSLRPPRISREQEARRPRVPLVVVKREVEKSSIKSIKFFVDYDYEDVKPPIKVEVDPRQLRAGVASLTIRPPQSSASTSSSEVAAAAPGPSRWVHRTEALCRIPAQSLGPADPPEAEAGPRDLSPGRG